MTSDTPTSVVATLMAARALLEKSDSWTKWALARDKFGDFTYPTEPDACKWCLHGALIRCDASLEAYKALDRIILPHTSVWTFNDAPNRQHHEVLTALDKAISLASQENS